ncbi:MAG: DUF4360 domain-containing protein [Dactylosporangium sp.]|nr:DUF4360 domain-containing protein [Dactylosporangium sp.]NNJ60513.1 DUF4360 domain-containing protein [Dactylosporangium sp.]
MLHVLTIGAVLASMLGSPQALELEYVTPPTEQIVIDVITVNGSGCPEGTAAIAVSEDNTAFTVTYSDYLAMVGVGASPIDFRKNCQLNLQVHVPAGFTYAIAQVDYRGYAYLEDGAIGIERANYYFQGMTPTVAASHMFTGPYDDNWQTTDTTDLLSLSYAPCGELRNLNINTELRVAAGTSDPTTTTSFMVMDSTDGSLSTVYHFTWKECPVT